MIELFIKLTLYKEKIMTRSMYWGLAILIFLLGMVAVSIITYEIAESQKLKKQLAEAEKLANQIKERKTSENNPPVAREGFKIVPHGDHWYEVPIDAPDTWQGESREPKSQDPLPDMSKYKIDFPEDIPEDFPTEAELRQMDSDQLLHLARLYTKASNELSKELRETDPDAGTRLYNATIPILYTIIDENRDRTNAIIEAMDREHRREFPVPRRIPATEESSAVFIDVKPPKPE